MKRRVSAALLAVLAPALSAISLGQEDLTINRREQARGNFRATPQSLYAHYCAHCHGEDGTGGGRLWASELSPPPADLTSLGADRSYVVETIREGSAVHGKSSLCPPWERTLSAPNIERLAQYIASLSSGSSGSGSSEAPPELETQPIREPFPLLLMLVVVAEGALLWRFLPRNTEATHVVSKDSSVGG